jgi:TatD DNase family protein
MLIDTHSHLNFVVFKNDFKEVIKKCLDNDIWMINVGTKYETSKRAIEIAKEYQEGVYAAIGLHPLHLETGLVKIKNDDEEITLKTKEEFFDYEKYKELANSIISKKIKSKKLVAIGEIGLDYYWKPKTKKKLEVFKEKQKEVLLQQLNLAKELNLPVIFHCRFAHQDLIEILKNYELGKLKGVLHCFTGTLNQAKEYLEMGFYFGFNGIIFKKTENLDFNEIIKKIPLEKILIETDCPYLTPPGFLEKRNNPLGVKLVAEKISQIKNISFEKLARITTQNAKELFQI